MPIIGAITTWTTNQVLTSSALNNNFATIRTAMNTYGLFTDVNRTITANLTFTPGSGVGITVSTGGVAVTGNSTITGDLAVSGALTKGGAAVVIGSGTSGKLTRFSAASTVADAGASDNGTYTSNANNPRARAVKTTNTLANSATAITFDSAPLNVATMWAGGAPTRLTIPANAGGAYLFSLAFQAADSAGGADVSFKVRKNGSSDVATVVTNKVNTANINYTMALTVVDDAAAADYYEFFLWSGTTTTSAAAIVASVVKIW